jgi:hypothetical protein
MILRKDSLKKKTWSRSYFEPHELFPEIKEEYVRCIPKLL